MKAPAMMLEYHNFYHLSVKMEDRSSNRYPSLSNITNGKKLPKIKT